jgi:hypothetical protein
VVVVVVVDVVLVVVDVVLVVEVVVDVVLVVEVVLVGGGPGSEGPPPPQDTHSASSVAAIATHARTIGRRSVLTRKAYHSFRRADNADLDSARSGGTQSRLSS